MKKHWKLLLAILLAIVCGAGLGICAAVAKIHQNPWQGGVGSRPLPEGGEVSVDEVEFNFGRLEVKQNDKHEFKITNKGDSKLILNKGITSCSCTVSEIKDSELAPGQSTDVVVSWRSKEHTGPFHQSVTITTSDPRWHVITFQIKGEFYRAVYADPEELNFGQISGAKEVTLEARILSNLPNQTMKVASLTFSNPSQEGFFSTETRPLRADELKKYNGIATGLLMRVSVKPGLPLGRFQQTIQLTTNLQDKPLDIHLYGEVGEITMVGHGWSSEESILEIGTLDGKSTTQRQLMILARGPDAKQMKFRVARVEPDFLKVKVGAPKVDESGELSQTQVMIEIPSSKELGKKAPANYMGGDHGRLGEILLETTAPHPHSLPIRVRFAVPDGK
jgi:hypothetical protein